MTMTTTTACRHSRKMASRKDRQSKRLVACRALCLVQDSRECRQSTILAILSVWNWSLETFEDDARSKESFFIYQLNVFDWRQQEDRDDDSAMSFEPRSNKHQLEKTPTCISHSSLTCRVLPDCCRMIRLLSLLLDEDELEGDASWFDCITNGVLMSGCSSMLGTLPPPFSLLLNGNVVIIARRCIRSSTVDGLIVTSGCSKIRSSLWERFLARSLLPFFADERLLKSKTKMINGDVQIAISQNSLDLISETIEGNRSKD